MTINRRLLYGGAFFVAVGGVTLFATGGAASSDAVAGALGLWPIALIALGAGLLLRRTRFGLAGGVIAAAMPGLLLGGLVVAAPRVLPDCGDLQPAGLAAHDGTFGGAATVDLRLACGELTVTTAPGNGWLLQAGNATGAVPTVVASADRLLVASSTERRPFGFTRGGDVWQLSLPAATRLDLTAEVSAGRGRFDLAGAQLGSVRLAVNAGEARVDLSAASVDHLSMSVNAASASLLLPASQDIVADLAVSAGALRICSAEGTGLRIRDTAVLAATHYPGLVRTADAWETPGYSMASHHGDLAITASVGSVDVNPTGGCQ